MQLHIGKSLLNAARDAARRALRQGCLGPALVAVAFAAAAASAQVPTAASDPPRSAGSPVSIVDPAFAIPQLERTRRIRIYLPPDYAASGKHYPVLYMQDGQKAFSSAAGSPREWSVDTILDRIHAEDAAVPIAIVVAVDNDSGHRLDEYNPWRNPADPAHGGGEGDRYADFLVWTLKPWIDAHYRTRTGPLDTGIMGSSLGGLIALYTAVKYPEVFSVAGMFSHALWLAAEPMREYAATPRMGKRGQRFYFVSGAAEGEPGHPFPIAEDQRSMVEALAASGLPRSAVRSYAPADGQHADWFWRREFPAAYRWMFAAMEPPAPDAADPAKAPAKP